MPGRSITRAVSSRLRAPAGWASKYDAAGGGLGRKFTEPQEIAADEEAACGRCRGPGGGEDFPVCPIQGTGHSPRTIWARNASAISAVSAA
jgi:hypothetical protein